ncbi:MAG TPA: hypothetical protein VHT04_08965 [Stellaceae bacterium]|nr:hypothetical protein [Stellaceae bacterium]
MINQLVALLAVSAVAALPTPSSQSAGLRPVACETQQDLFDLLNAADRNDLKEAARLTVGACRPLAGLHYDIVDEENGVLTVRLFPREDDWTSSRLGFTLDEMVPVN